jgi:hypothetical protein
MGITRKISGGFLAFVGYTLSPLSWWNDLFVNVPLALVFAWVVSAFDKPVFGVSVVLGYWLTNVLGFILSRAIPERECRRASASEPEREGKSPWRSGGGGGTQSGVRLSCRYCT